MNPEKASKALGIIAIIYAILGILILAGILALSVFLFRSIISTSTGSSSIAKTSLSPVFFILLLILAYNLAASILWLISGIGLVKLEPWSRTITIVASAVGILQIPSGIIMGIVYFVFMFNKDLKNRLKTFKSIEIIK